MKMAKNKFIKRILAKNGEVRYYQSGKRITAKLGVRKFIKQNPNVEPLSDKEKRSQKALLNYKKGWKFKGRSIQEYYITILDRLKVISRKNIKDNDLYNIFENGKRKFTNFEDLTKFIADQTKPNKKDSPAQKEFKKGLFQFCSEKGLPGYRGRDFETFANNRLTNIVDIVDLLNTKTFKYYNFYVIDRQRDLIVGRILGLLALRDFEIYIGENIKKLVSNSAFIRFCYNYQADVEKRIVTIDLQDIHPNEDEFEGYKSLSWYVENSGGTEAKQSIIINDKYKDCEITIQFS
jgi:hypothetical protein